VNGAEYTRKNILALSGAATNGLSAQAMKAYGSERAGTETRIFLYFITEIVISKNYEAPCLCDSSHHPFI
jgi:Pyruvate/2-oxoacid:ferredoxin oxidoreductase gamma subunit